MDSRFVARRFQMIRAIHILALLSGPVLLELLGTSSTATEPGLDRQRFLYVASPGVRDNLEWGGHGVLVFDINDGHRFVRRISLDDYGTDKTGKVLNVKGICANANTGRLYV